MLFRSPYQRPDFQLSLALELQNNTDADINDLITISLTFSYVPDILNSSLVQGSGILDTSGARGIAFDPAQSGEVYTLHLGSLGSRQYARFSFDARFTKSVVSAVLRQDVDITLSVSAVAGVTTATASAVSRLLPPLTKE